MITARFLFNTNIAEMSGEKWSVMLNALSRGGWLRLLMSGMPNDTVNSKALRDWQSVAVSEETN